jgi:hypothetical protein
VGHLWYNSGTNFAGSVRASTLRDYPSARMIRTFKSPALGLTPTAPFQGHFILVDSRPELSYSDSRSETLESGQVRERHVFNMTKKDSKNRSLSDTDGVTINLQPYKVLPGLHSNYTRFFSMIANIADHATCIFL